jgi:hypothetical protein
MEGLIKFESGKYKQQVIKCLNYIEVMYKKEEKGSLIELIDSVFGKI